MSSGPPLPKKAKLEVDDETDLGGGVVEDQFDGEEQEDDNWECAKEEEVGITEYLCDKAGFFGILKRRYCDFVVHEVASNGSIVKLTNYSLPIELRESEMTPADLEVLLGAETIAAIKQLSENSETGEEVRFKAPLDKAERGKLHRSLRALYPLLESETLEAVKQVEVQENEDHGGTAHKTVVVRRSSNRKGFRGNWPRDRGSYCKFVLHKEDRSTMDAIMVLSRLLKVKPNCFNFAGVKDKRGITSQHITAFKITADRLKALNDRLLGMALGNFQYVSEPLKLGSLKGNHFSIVLRNVSCEDHVISEGVASLATNGFINYFGMQRFGTSSIPTHHIGRCLLHSNWKGAIDLILKPRKGDKVGADKAKEYYESSDGDVSGTLALMPKSCYIERCLLTGLKKRKPVKDFYGAFNFIPRGNRVMYLHSWQSWCWNRLVSWRLKHLGMEPVPGDLAVKVGEEGVSYVTEENRSDYRLEDVVIPLPGYNIQLPHNKVKEEYENILTEEDIGLEQLQAKIKSLSLPGSYRHMVVKPLDLQWNVHHYADFKDPLILTDIDHLVARKLPKSENGDHKALKLEFSLPSSSYATMAVRELTKMETSSAYQATLGD